MRGPVSRPERSTPPHPLSAFTPAARAWFEGAFEGPTAAQGQGWPAIAAGDHTLICAPTGSGKTLAAFLWCLDRLLSEERPTDPLAALRVLYVSPLKALVHDVDRNLRAPLAGIAIAAQRLGAQTRDVRVGMRTGDTPAEERRAFGRRPPDILVTTPESLYLILTSQARAALRGVRWVIVDEIHALAGTKRGAHLALSLERLETLVEQAPQRIGLSATQRPLSAVAAYLGGRQPADGPGVASPRRVTIVDAGVRKPLELRVVVPVADMGRLGEVIPLEEAPGGPTTAPDARTSIWPSIYPRIVELIREHRSTIVFTNSRRLAERLALNLNELAGEELALAHHGSIAREQRMLIEERLKGGRLPAIVATSSLELGIDMGAVDLVIQVESPLSVARGLQRIGRAGHQVGAPSRGVIFPKYRGDLLETAVVARLMHEGAIEPTVVPRSPLDVLAQQVVAMALDRPWPVDDLLAVVRRAESYADLSVEVFEATLAMLAGQFPSDEFAELRPRLIWDRTAGTVVARRDARVVAVTSGGTIPDRGLFPVYLADDAVSDETTPVTRARAARGGGRRVGELDEEMVYEAREGEVILLGASAWRIESIGHDRVLVSPAPGEPGKVPFWKGDGVGRPVELGRAIGAFTRELWAQASRGPEGRREAHRHLLVHHDLDDLAADNVLGYLDEEHAACGVLPTDRTIVLQRFRDELGDWRVCLLTPFGARVHAPWALAIEARLRETLGVEVQPIWSDDGIVVRLPATEGVLEAWSGAPAADEAVGPVALEAGFVAHAGGTAPFQAEAAVLVPAAEVEELVTTTVGGSALFASRFRENAARALLLPRRRPGLRTPLWQMRQRASQLLAVASRFATFPIVLETYREVLADVFDLPALRDILSAIERREIRVVSVETSRASPFASSLLFDYIATYMYEGDAPLLDRRAQALALDRELLRELLGAEQLRDLLDAGALADLELELQALTAARAAASADGVHDLLRRLGDLTEAEVTARVRGPGSAARADLAGAWLATLHSDRRALRVRMAGEWRWIALEDAVRYRDAVGVSLPPGTPELSASPPAEALRSLLTRWARSHGPFLTQAPTDRWQLPHGPVEQALEGLMAAGALLRGEFRPGGVEREWCDPEVLRMLRRRSLARLRREIEPVEPAALARFLPAWQGVGSGESGLARLADVIAQLEGLALPASVLERDVLPSRVRSYSPQMLDELGAAGEVVWVGAGSLGRDDGRVALYRPDRMALLRPELASGSAAGPSALTSWLHEALREHLVSRGAAFYRELSSAVAAVAERLGEQRPGDRELLDALWDLVWAGAVSNDTFAPLRALRWPRRSGDRRSTPARPRLGSRMGPPEGAGRWWLVAETVGATPPGGPSTEPTGTERRAALAAALLERQGVVTRDGVLAESVVGGFGAVYGVLREMEERGRVRRGYFVEGLGGAQFALAGAVDRLRAARADAEPGRDGRTGTLTLAAADPANPYGAVLPWPGDGGRHDRTPTRSAGAYVVLHDGQLVVHLERGGRSLLTWPPFDDDEVAGRTIEALRSLTADGRLHRLQLERVDGREVAASPRRARLEALGFRASYRGLVLAPQRVAVGHRP
jgi:ATP-dependent Lhr-like helicase